MYGMWLKWGGGVYEQDYVHIYSCHRQHMVCCDLHSNSFEQLSKRRYFQHVATPLGLLTHTRSLLTVFTVSDLTQEDNSTHYNRSFLRGEAKSSAWMFVPTASHTIFMRAQLDHRHTHNLHESSARPPPHTEVPEAPTMSMFCIHSNTDLHLLLELCGVR